MSLLHPGLQILYTLLQNVAQEEAAAQSFYQTYFCDILQHIFSVVTDTSHTAGEFIQITTEGTLLHKNWIHLNVDIRKTMPEVIILCEWQHV